MKRIIQYWISVIIVLSTGCSDRPWNNPYRSDELDHNIYYDTFSERPKHLDPASAYAANEYAFLGQIYEPPFQYHFLKRPYELVPLIATTVPQARFYGSDGELLDHDVSEDKIHHVIYKISIQPGVLYQPHPAFARDKDGIYHYHYLSRSDLKQKHRLADFTETGTRELIAEDYVYQIKRLVHPDVHTPIAGLMTKYILGLNELSAELLAEHKDNNEKSHYIDLRRHDLRGVKVLDRYTFEITLKEKYPQFRYWLSMPFFAPMPWEADYFYSQPGMREKNITLDWYPVGTGPFMLVENNPNRRMVLKRNPNFRGELYPGSGEPGDKENGFLADAGKKMPFIDMAVFSLEKESIPAWNKFLQGYYDTSGIVSDSFDQAVQFNTQGDAQLTGAMREKNIHLLTAVTTSTFYMGFNMRDDIVGGSSDRTMLLRRAISIAVDYEEFISIFQNGRGIATQGPLPKGIFGYREGKEGINPYIYKWHKNKAQRRTIEEARQLMIAAGYPDGRDEKTGEPLLLNLDSAAAGPGTKAIFDWFRKQFAKLGITVVIRATDFNRFQEKIRKGTAQIFMMGWNADYPDPENFLFLLYGPNAKVNTNGENAANYENEEFDKLFNKMKSMANGPERQLVLDKMVMILQRDAPWLWGFHPVAFSLHHSWYKNAKPNLMSNNTLKYKRIDQKLRNEYRKNWNQPIYWPIVLLAIIFIISIIPAYRSYKRKEQSAAL